MGSQLPEPEGHEKVLQFGVQQCFGFRDVAVIFALKFGTRVFGRL